jgi:hypothetical protein
VDDKFVFESFKKLAFALFVLKARGSHCVLTHMLCNTGRVLHAFADCVSFLFDLCVSFLASLSPSLGVSTAFFVGLEAFSKFGTDGGRLRDVFCLGLFEIFSSSLDNVNQSVSRLFAHVSFEVLDFVSSTHFATFMVLLVGVLAAMLLVGVLAVVIVMVMVVVMVVVIVMVMVVVMAVSLIMVVVVVMLLSAMVVVLLIIIIMMVVLGAVKVAFLLGSGCSGVGSNANGKGGEEGDLGEHDVKL